MSLPILPVDTGPAWDEYRDGVRLTFRTDAINYEKKSGANRHNENGVEVKQGHDIFFDDTTTAWYSCTDKTCNLTVALDSEVDAPLFHSGFMQLSYDKVTKRWSMKAYQEAPGWSEEWEDWRFCSPEVVLDHVTSILTYLSQDREKDTWYDGQLVESEFDTIVFSAKLEAIVGSLKENQAALRRGAELYARGADCSAPPISQMYISKPDTSRAAP